SPGVLKKVYGFAAPEFEPVLADFRKQLKHPLAPRDMVVLLRCQTVGRLGERVVVEDRKGTRIEAVDRHPGDLNLANLVRAAVDRVVGAPPKQVAPALLDLLLVVRQVRASLTAAGADGAAEPVPPSGPWTTAAPTRDLEGWLDALTASGYDRPKRLKKALQQP